MVEKAAAVPVHSQGCAGQDGKVSRLVLDRGLSRAATQWKNKSYVPDMPWFQAE
jgi:hypothetical protein